MNLTRHEIKYLQKSVGATADGAIGPKTKRAFRKASAFRGRDDKVVVYYIQWLNNKQKRTPKLILDGIFGPLSDRAMDMMAGQGKLDPVSKGSKYSTKPSVIIQTNIVPPKTGTANLTRFYGKPGDTGNLVRMTFPGIVTYGGKRVKTTRVHKKAKESFEYYMEKDLSYFGQTQLTSMGLMNFSGCYNFRKMRGGRRASTHSWGISSDTDAGNNRMSFGRDHARFAKVAYQAHWQHVYEAGFICLGFTGAIPGGVPTQSSYDWMHIQLTR